MDQVSKIIGDRIRTIRQKNGLTQSELADRAGVAVTTIGSLERGDTGTKLTTLWKAIDALDISYYDFFKPVDIELKKASTPTAATSCYDWLKDKTTDQQERILRILKEIDGFN